MSVANTVNGQARMFLHGPPAPLRMVMRVVGQDAMPGMVIVDDELPAAPFVG
jgi:hypothetical protein